MTWKKPTRREATQWTADSLPTPREPVALRIPDTRARLCVPIPKNPPLRSTKYRRWVASLDCAHCGRGGRSQAAHSDSDGKGLQIKAGDETCWPACADEPDRRGCHSLIGSTGAFTREQRRVLETRYAGYTRAVAREVGTWPKGWK